MQILRSAPDRNQLGRYVASLFGLIALICFYQPWVSASLPSVGDAALTGMDLARGEAARRVDEATFGKSVRPGASGAAGATVAPGSAIGGLVLPTRIATVVPGAVVGGLTVPTRVPTVAANTGGAAAAASA